MSHKGQRGHDSRPAGDYADTSPASLGEKSALTAL